MDALIDNFTATSPKIRNGIVHYNIEAINENNVWKGDQIHNINHDKVKDFKIIFTVVELKH